MRSTAVRKTRSKRPARGAQNRRGGLRPARGIEETGIINQVGSQEQRQVDISSIFDSQSRVSWSDTLAALEKESLASQIRRHKEWKRNGSIHEDYCRVCLKSDSLEPCLTCRLAFHGDCMPAGWLRNPQNELFCVICVRRGWHIIPPALTPPASPRLTEAHGAPATGTPAIEVDSVSLSNPHSHATPLHRQPQASSTHEQSINDREAIPATNPAREASPDNDEMNENMYTQSGVSQPPRRQRKSRYMSLPSEVDASLNVLYRELESNASLRLEIENLREENTRCMQTIQMRDLNLMALRRELERRRFSEQELERLQANAAQLENANKEIQELRAKNESLEAELQISRESAKEAKALVDDWKSKLSLLINN
ncbi:hypothetical protein BDV27DRAFT_167384 [Aspergillus caelatus]|uniref:Zinc finger PHD-type domain-containing protein n=1 Tax=Aspergillus caelatus TaxID=61420 RepID=A0A5N6ZU06_9EURO|nr:uncharacterized protein BDV27DRAFT_167384 [Aspergillus caelatus]KAE8360878.1 hypothetical protein BDV27DRAFT_167384 [Aspergillus caelatus]